MIFDTPGKPERRQSPRYELDVEADLVLDKSRILTFNTRNISSHGLQVSCSSWVTDEIEPRGIQSQMYSRLQLKVIIKLPVHGRPEKLYADCRLMTLQRLSQNEYLLNLVFTGFEYGSDNVLDRFLGQYQQKRTVVGSLA